MPRSHLPSVLASKKVPAAANTVPIDPTLLDDLEAQAASVAKDLTTLLDGLKAKMGEITSSTLASLKVHDQAVTNLAASAEECVQQTLGLITGMDELSHDMTAVHALSVQM
ncbi:hypothetical protein HK104_006320 [Borealophlyctis nickersoniae]|nr:hypothetical protein HK104_006320 [Borealophlyctis nickersoniae]